jgi:hypothetical protein
MERLLHCGRNQAARAQSSRGCNGAAEKNMKIYLLMMLIGALLTAIRFTSVPEQRSKTLPQ